MIATHPGAKKALAEVERRGPRHALDAANAFDAIFGSKFPKAVAKLTNDLDELLAFYDYPAEHWVHLRTTDEIVNPFAGRGLLCGPFSCSLAVAA
jgi:transposase-like protein